MALLETHDLRKTYRRGKLKLDVLRGIDVKIHAGEFVAVIGPSGSGKTTFMQLLGALDRPTSGSVQVDGQRLETWSDGQLSRFRRRKLGFIFQFFNLIPTQTAEENVALPLLLDGQSYAKVIPAARELLDRMGLAERAKHRPGELSGGEMQRVAIARALIANPLLVLADEPTGNLDSKTGTIVLELFRAIVKERGQTVVMVTHDARAADYSDRVIVMRDGLVECEQRTSRPPSRGRGDELAPLRRPAAAVPAAATRSACRARRHGRRSAVRCHPRHQRVHAVVLSRQRDRDGRQGHVHRVRRRSRVSRGQARDCREGRRRQGRSAARRSARAPREGACARRQGDHDCRARDRPACRTRRCAATAAKTRTTKWSTTRSSS